MQYSIYLFGVLENLSQFWSFFKIEVSCFEKLCGSKMFNQ